MTNNRIYLDNCSTTPMDPAVWKAMKLYFTSEFGNASSNHSWGLFARDAIDTVRQIIADEIKSKKSEIIFTSGATESINLAIKGTCNNNTKNGHIITQVTEHKAVLETCKEYEQCGWDITYLPVNEVGEVDINMFRNSLRDDTVLVALMHANNEIGTFQPIKKVGNILKDHKAVFFVDSAQTFGKYEIDVQNSFIDLLAASSHKIYGPKGVGFLYIKSTVNIKPQITGGGQELGYRSGTLPTPLIVGMGEAVKICKQRRSYENSQIKYLRDKLLDGIKGFNYKVKLNGPADNRLFNNLNISFRNIDADVLISKTKLGLSSGSACTSGSLETSHVVRAISDDQNANSAVRFGIGRFNTEKEIDEALIILNKVISTFNN